MGIFPVVNYKFTKMNLLKTALSLLVVKAEDCESFLDKEECQYKTCKWARQECTSICATLGTEAQCDAEADTSHCKWDYKLERCRDIGVCESLQDEDECVNQNCTWVKGRGTCFDGYFLEEQDSGAVSLLLSTGFALMVSIL